MGCIYKIRNRHSGKLYIGATTRTLVERIREHKKTYANKNSRLYDSKLYTEMRKEGFESFEYGVVQVCDNSELEKLEKYYIQKFDCINNGYNEALGGSGKPLWTEEQLERCKTLYENGWLLKDIALLFNSSPKTVSKKLRDKYNIETRENSHKSFSKKVCGIDIEGEEICFDSLSDAGRYLIAHKYTSNKNLVSVLSKIEISIKNNNSTAYGFKWNYL